MHHNISNKTKTKTKTKIKCYRLDVYCCLILSHLTLFISIFPIKLILKLSSTAITTWNILADYCSP